MSHVVQPEEKEEEVRNVYHHTVTRPAADHGVGYEVDHRFLKSQEAKRLYRQILDEMMAPEPPRSKM